METPTTDDLPPSIDEDKLPETYDRLVPAAQLVHGEYNPRRVRPTTTLRTSIQQSGLTRALIVRPADNSESYHITDGWQRYQAATDCGWEYLPVTIYESPLAALEATEAESIVREWSTYEWARYCQSVGAQLNASSRQDRIDQVADRTAKSPSTVRRYLDVLTLPDEIHPLLRDGPEGSEQAWRALRNYNEDIRRYDGLAWTVASHLARQQDSLSRTRVIGIAARAVAFEGSEQALEFIDRATDATDKPLDIVRKEVLIGQQHPQYLEVPRVLVQLDHAEKEALMEYCRQNRESLSDIISERLKSLAAACQNDIPPE